mmetsp:Transcript_7737/g.18961  ORF Transcript_7737/g.18961 Transcript_7737/m.18961 type:complete len:218 (-) Transcript_7737:39-692(-)
MQVCIDIAGIRVVFCKASSVHVISEYVSLHGKPGFSGSIGKFNRVGPNENNLFGGIGFVEALRPVTRLVLQQDIVPHAVLGFFRGIDFSLIIMIGLGNVIRSTCPPELVKPVVRGRLRGRRAFFHSITMSHGSLGKVCCLHFDNGLVLLPGLGFGLVQVPYDAFGGDLVNLVLGPWISGRNGLGGRLFQQPCQLLQRLFVSANDHCYILSLLIIAAE